MEEIRVMSTVEQGSVYIKVVHAVEQEKYEVSLVNSNNNLETILRSTDMNFNAASRFAESIQNVLGLPIKYFARKKVIYFEDVEIDETGKPIKE